MGYYVIIQSCKIKLPKELTNDDTNTVNAVIKILDDNDIVNDYWLVEDNEIVPVEYDLNLDDNLDTSLGDLDDDFYKSLKYLSKVGCTGYVELSGDNGEWVKFVLKDGKLFIYYAEMTYPKKPTYVL